MRAPVLAGVATYGKGSENVGSAGPPSVRV